MQTTKKMAFIGVTKPDLLMSDSTNSGVEDFSISERKVANEIQDIMRKTKQRLIVATFASNVHRVAQIIEAATNLVEKLLYLDVVWKTLWILEEKWVQSKLKIQTF